MNAPYNAAKGAGNKKRRTALASLSCRTTRLHQNLRAVVDAMNCATWEAIARRQAWYLNVLERRLAEWPNERIDSCTDLVTLRYLIQLAQRLERHEQLMIQHLRKRITSPAN